MASDEDLQIRPMKEGELDLAIAWAAAEGWNPGIHDAACFYAADPKGFFRAELNGQPVGAVSAVAYDDHFGFAGFFLVLPAYRGRGIGLRLGQTVFNYLGDRAIGIDGVLAQQANYRRAGFVTAYRNFRFQTKGMTGDATGLTEIDRVPFADLVAYDRQHFYAPRTEFLRRWTSQPGAAAWAVIEHGRLRGYGVMRACRTGYKIGPLFADDPSLAEALFAALCGRAQNEPVLLDIPECNQAAFDLVEQHNMQRVFETARMYNRPVQPLPYEHIFGITSYELG